MGYYFLGLVIFTAWLREIRALSARQSVNIKLSLWTFSKSMDLCYQPVFFFKKDERKLVLNESDLEGGCANDDAVVRSFQPCRKIQQTICSYRIMRNLYIWEFL